MESGYFYTASIMISSHMYTTEPFSCNLMCGLTKYVSGTKWTYCIVHSNSQSKQIILVYYCSNMVWSKWNDHFILMWSWFVINFELLVGSWLLLVHLSYHWLTEEFCGCNKQVLFVFCDGSCLSTSAHCVGFISPEICELVSTHPFIQATHKKIPGMWISLHILNVNFYYQWYF